MTKQEHTRRYRLHAKIKDIVSLKSRQRQISVPYGYETQNKCILELINKFHYNLQFHIEIPDINSIQVHEPEILKL
jgi:hypothetical protein